MKGKSAGTRAATAVVLGLSPTGLYAVRELGRAGYSVLGVAAHGQAGAWSRYLTRGVIVDVSEWNRLERLLRHCEGAADPPVLVPTSDQDIDFVMRHRAMLSERFRMQASYLDGTAESIMAKATFYRLCETHGIAAPRTLELEREEVALAGRDITYPCLVKPSRIHAVKAAMAGRKAWTADSEDDLCRIAVALPEGGTSWLVQEIIPGPESDITLCALYVDRRGVPRQQATARKLRQYPPGFGSASWVRTASEPETRTTTERFLKAVGFKGIAAAEFKRDARDGRLKIIEINPRPSLWFAVTAAAGKTITLAACRDLSGAEPLPEASQIDGVDWRYGGKDAVARALYAAGTRLPLPPPAISGLQKPVRRVSAVFAADDPAPIAGEAAFAVGKVVGRALKRWKGGGST